jgi:type VI secretion system protein ImpK
MTGTGTSPAGANGLAVAAAPLLQLLARLRNTATPPCSGDLRERAVEALRRFEQRVRSAGVPAEQARAAHQALCASLDDVVLNTPWGSAGGWAAASLTAAFHRDARFPDAAGEDWFFDQLARMWRDPAGWLPVLELMYLCLSLGFMGRCRRSANGPMELERVRTETYAAIVRQRRPASAELSPQWTGVAAPYRPGRAGLPVWVAGSAALALVVVVFVWCSAGLGAASDDVYAGMLAAAPSTMPRIFRGAMAPLPPPPEPAEPGLAERLRTLLKGDIDRGLVSVLGNASATVLRLPADGMFAAESATLQPTALPLLERAGAALREAAGGAAASARVIGYTDNQPVRSVRFPSNFELSASRALAVREVLGGVLGDAVHLTAEGRAGADPVAANASAAGREQNRRIEIVLQRQQ